jgi:hypothetical protein
MIKAVIDLTGVKLELTKTERPRAGFLCHGKATEHTDKSGRPMAARGQPRIAPAGQSLRPDRAGHLSESHYCWPRAVYCKWRYLCCRSIAFFNYVVILVVYSN